MRKTTYIINEFYMISRFLLMIFCLLVGLTLRGQGAFTPGQQWDDKDGKNINAHGGCVVYDDGVYYWFGEDRTGMTSNGVSCYKSVDLYDWERVGLALTLAGPQKEDLNDIGKGRTIERPKVVYNEKTQKWIMWAHWETGDGYGAARVMVAISDKPQGPYKLYKTFRPNGRDSRDQTIFLDDDGELYHFASTDMNTNTSIALISEDFLEPTGEEFLSFKGLRYEAHSIFKQGEIYFGLFSGTTGWDPNPGHSAYTTTILGEWIPSFNFAVDSLKQLTYRSQSNYVFKVPGKEQAFIYMGDRWNPQNIEASHHVWLPISLRSGFPTVRWYDEWNLSVFDNMYRYKRARNIVSGNVYALLEKRSDRLVSKPKNGFTIADDNDEINLNFEFIGTDQPNIYRLKDVKTGYFVEAVFGTLRLNKENHSDAQLWVFEKCTAGYYKVKSVKDEKYLTVSGSNTFDNTNLYLAEESNEMPQEFAAYFDSDKYDYLEADIFMASYLNRELGEAN